MRARRLAEVWDSGIVSHRRIERRRGRSVVVWVAWSVAVSAATWSLAHSDRASRDVPVVAPYVSPSVVAPVVEDVPGPATPDPVPGAAGSDPPAPWRSTTGPARASRSPASRRVAPAAPRVARVAPAPTPHGVATGPDNNLFPTCTARGRR